jgi:hypothetical protein
VTIHEKSNKCTICRTCTYTRHTHSAMYTHKRIIDMAKTRYTKTTTQQPSLKGQAHRTSTPSRSTDANTAPRIAIRRPDHTPETDRSDRAGTTSTLNGRWLAKRLGRGKENPSNQRKKQPTQSSYPQKNKPEDGYAVGRVGWGSRSGVGVARAYLLIPSAGWGCKDFVRVWFGGVWVC